MTHKAYKAVKKYRVFARYKDKSHPACVEATLKAKKLIKAARRNFERKLAVKIKEDKISFFAYLRSRTKSKFTPGPLSNSDNNNSNINSAPMDDREVADKFNEYFSLVFTDENMSNVPLCNTTFPYPGRELSDVHIA